MAAIVEFDQIGAIRLADRANGAAELDREIEAAGVFGQVGRNVVTRRVAIRVAGKGEAGESAVAHRREQPQRVPALAPGRPDLAGRLENRGLAALASEEVPHCEASLAGSDNDHLAAVYGVHRCYHLPHGKSESLRPGVPCATSRIAASDGPLAPGWLPGYRGTRRLKRTGYRAWWKKSANRYKTRSKRGSVPAPPAPWQGSRSLPSIVSGPARRAAWPTTTHACS